MHKTHRKKTVNSFNWQIFIWAKQRSSVPAGLRNRQNGVSHHAYGVQIYFAFSEQMRGFLK